MTVPWRATSILQECMLSHFSQIQLFETPGTQAPCPLDSPGTDTGVGCHFLLQGFSWPRDWTCISCWSCIAGGFFTAWATREALKKATRPCEFLYHYAYIIMVSHPGLPLLSWASSCNTEDNVSLWLAHLIFFSYGFLFFVMKNTTQMENTGIPHFTELHRYSSFHKWRSVASYIPALSKSTGTVFLTVCAHFMSLCHILVIFKTFQTSYCHSYIYYGDL